MNNLNRVGCTGLVRTIGLFSAAFSLGILLSACDGAGSIPSPVTPTPTAPTPPAPTVPLTPPTYTLSGVVFELTAGGRTPVEGVEVYCDSCGSPVGHTWVYTDARGVYSLDWSANGVHPLIVTKEGYRHANGARLDKLGRISATVDGDSRFDVELVRR